MKNYIYHHSPIRMGGELTILPYLTDASTLAEGFETLALSEGNGFVSLETTQALLENLGTEKDLTDLIQAYKQAAVFQNRPRMRQLGAVIAEEIRRSADKLDRLLKSFPRRQESKRTLWIPAFVEITSTTLFADGSEQRKLGPPSRQIKKTTGPSQPSLKDEVFSKNICAIIPGKR